ncbi:hypothetical protein [Gemmata massiliana]|uniref:hypothetical protein n=1 Tax=Gemmata massiliana TaxID=1210884 RepID=UPI0013A6D658|nr:hypothetical protein [Gemmata massiliana]
MSKPFPAGVTFDTALVETRIAEADPAYPRAPRVPRKRSSRAAKIELLSEELIRHLRDAKA